VGFRVLREIRKVAPRFAGQRIEVTVQRRVAEQLLGPGRESLRALETELGREIEIRVRPDIHQEQFEIRAVGPGGRVTLELPWLDGVAAAPPEPREPVEEALAPRFEAVGEDESAEPEFGPAGIPVGGGLVAAQPVDGEDEFPILPDSEEREER